MEFDFIATSDKRKINIEVENKVKNKMQYISRTEAYTSTIFLEKFKKGMDYEELLKTTSISIVNYNISDDKEFYTHHAIKLDFEDISSGKLEYYIIQIPKFRKHIKKAIKKRWHRNIYKLYKK
jgi:hypothetical protein